jgi:multiple sugar transport system ATP-binding protein
MATVALDNIKKSYGDRQVVHGVSCDIADGELVVVVGPSGCGKSTLLRMIAGLENVTTGEIRIADRVVNDLAPRDRDLAMVFQSYALYPHMSVADNMSFNLKLRRMAPGQIGSTVRAAGEKLGLGHLMKRKPRDLSGGQRQRVAMGRAIVRQPKAFLFDEPLSNLDARLREQMRYELRKMHRELGATSIYVTHDQIEAMTMADRIVAMHEGVIQQIGPPRALYDDPANIFVAGFIGSPAMNFLEGKLTSAGGQNMLTIAGYPLSAVGNLVGGVGGASITVGLRPERIALSSRAGGVPARVESVETTGLGLVIHLDLVGQSLTAFSTSREVPAAGDTFYMVVDPSDVLLFDSSSGVRLRPAS